MNEQSFIREMQSALGGLPAEQREDIIAEYRSHFFEGKERGKSEDDIAKGLGDPRAVSRTYLADYHYTAWYSPAPGQSVRTSLSHLVRAVLLTLSLLFFNFFFALVPVLIYSALLGGAWVFAGGAALVGSTLFFLALLGGSSGIVLPTVSTQLALLFYSLGAVSLSLFFGCGLYFLSRLSLRWLMKYINLNIKLAKA